MKIKIEVESSLPMKETMKEVARAIQQPATIDLLWHYDVGEGFVMQQPNVKITLTKQ